MAKPNVTCAECEKPMVSVRPQGEARCRACPARCGTANSYKRGCRCGECRASVAVAMRDYQARRKARDGISQFTQYNMCKAAAEGREYIPEAHRMVGCAVCGIDVLRRDTSSPLPAMHRDCGQTAEGRRLRFIANAAVRAEESAERALGGDSPKLNRFRKRMEKVAAGKSAGGRVFVQGKCDWCEESFCAPMGKWCSSKCKNAGKLAARHPDRFNPTPALRASVYERDSWVCGLCDLPIDKSLSWPDKWSASLDHVVPQSHMSIPDHSALNLRAVHLQCNSMRGDGSNMSEDELIRRVHSEIGGGLLVAS